MKTGFLNDNLYNIPNCNLHITQHTNHQSLQDLTMSTMKELCLELGYVERKLSRNQYIMPSFHLVWKYLRGSIKGVNPLFSIQQLSVIFILVIVALYFILDRLTSFPTSDKENAVPRFTIKDIEVEEVSQEPAQDILMCHRRHNLSRHKRRLPSEHYFIHFKRFKYTIPELLPREEPIESFRQIINKGDESLAVPPSSLVSFMVMIFGVTVLIQTK